MRIIVTGAAGQVGTELQIKAPQQGHETISFPRSELDITDRENVLKIVPEHQPDIIINAGAYTAVDKAESEQEQAFLVNRDGSENLATACSELNIPLIHISTDYVFDGTKTSAYLETDPVIPVNAYGASKEAGETAIRNTLEKHIILRTSWVFSAHGGNFVKSMIRLANDRDELNIVADQKGGPTAASDIAETCLAIAGKLPENPAWGTYHYSGEPDTNWYEFAKEIINRASPLIEKAPAINPITTADYPTPAARPSNSVMNCRKIKNTFGINQPSWKDSLDKVISQLPE